MLKNSVQKLPASLKNEKLWFSFELWAKLIVELLTNPLGRHWSAVRRKDKTVISVWQDCNYAHVRSSVTWIATECRDFAIHLLVALITSKCYLQIFKKNEALFKDRTKSQSRYFGFTSILPTFPKSALFHSHGAKRTSFKN